MEKIAVLLITSPIWVALLALPFIAGLKFAFIVWALTAIVLFVVWLMTIGFLILFVAGDVETIISSADKLNRRQI